MTRNDLPKIIRIGITQYDLILWPPADAEAAEAWGICNILTCEIKVRDDLPERTFAEVLEHEINHGCWEAVKLEDRASEEAVIKRLTPAMIAARRDNPEIYAWIDQAFVQKV